MLPRSFVSASIILPSHSTYATNFIFTREDPAETANVILACPLPTWIKSKSVFQVARLNPDSFLAVVNPSCSSLNRLQQDCETPDAISLLFSLSTLRPSPKDARMLRRRYLPLIYPFNRYTCICM